MATSKLDNFTRLKDFVICILVVFSEYMIFTALCSVQRRQSEDVFLDRYRLSVNTFFHGIKWSFGVSVHCIAFGSGEQGTVIPNC